MKRCSTCRELKLLEDFNLKAKAQDGRQAMCRACSKASYQANREQFLLAAAARNANYRDDIHERLAAYLLAHPCVDCGEGDMRVLEFDHRDDEVKTGEVTRLLHRMWPWDRIRSEIRKCDVRCGNCHRKRTLANGTSWRQQAHLEGREAR